MWYLAGGGHPRFSDSERHLPRHMRCDRRCDMHYLALQLQLLAALLTVAAVAIQLALH